MSHPKEFKNLAELQKYFDGKGAGIFTNNEYVSVRIIDDVKDTSETSTYLVTDKGLKLKESQTTVKVNEVKVEEVKKEVPKTTKEVILTNVGLEENKKRPTAEVESKPNEKSK